MTSLSDFISRLIKSIIAAIAAIFGGVKEAGGLLADDARRIGRVARSVGEATARVVGTGLAGPARVLDGLSGGLGSLLPRGPVGPKAVADAAVASDNRRGASIPPVPAKAMAALEAAAATGQAIHSAAGALACGDDARAGRYAAELPAAVRAWLVGLTPREIARVIATDPFHLVAHIEGRSPAPGLPPVPAAPAPTPITDRAEMQRALAEIRRIARAERAEAVERATGGHRRPLLPVEDEPDYVPPAGSGGMRPAFH